MNRPSPERLKEIAANQEVRDRLRREDGASLDCRDLLAESAALRTERDRLEARLDETARERVHHMGKWQDDRVELMRVTPGYDYKNRVDDPEWATAKAIILRVLAAPASPDDLARVAEIRERVARLRARRYECRECGSGAGEGWLTYPCADHRNVAEDADWLLARLTPPTGPQER